MARVFIIASIMAGVCFLLTILGFPTFTGAILGAIGFSNGSFPNFWTSPLYIAVAVVFGIATLGTAITAGFFGNRISESFVSGSISLAIFTWIATDMISILNFVNDNNPWDSQTGFLTKIVALVIVIAMTGFAISIYQWWRGNDI